MKELPLGKKIDLFPPYLFRDLDRRRQEEVQKGRDVISLAIGDPDIPTPKPIAEFASKAVKKAANHRYPYGRGSAEFRNAVAAWHKRRHGIKLDPETEVLALIGSKEGLAHLPFALIDRGDSVIVPDPGYPPCTTGVLLSGGRLERLPLFEKDGFLPDFGRIPKKVLARSRMLFLNYPNNPTGASATLDFYKEAVKFCRKNRLWLAQDAAYSETYFGKPCPSVLQVPGAKDVAVEFYSLSKTYCMTGWRLGWLAGNARAVQALTKIKDNLDSGQFNAVQETGVFCLENHDRLSAPIRRAFKARMEFFSAALKAAGWKVFVPETTFFVWAKPPNGGKSIDAVYRMLSESAVLATPGSGFGPSGEGYVRFALCAPDTRIKEAAVRIGRLAW